MREERIEKEVKRLTSLFKEVEKSKVSLVKGLIKRAAFLMVSLEDIEEDINKNGTTEIFSQTRGIEYERERPCMKVYVNFGRNYGTTMKELIALMNKAVAKEVEDELTAFLKKKV